MYGNPVPRVRIPPSPPSNRSGNTLRVALQDEWRNSNPRFKSTGSTTGRRSVERRRRNAATAAPEGRDAQRRVIPPSPPNNRSGNTLRVALQDEWRNSNPRFKSTGSTTGRRSVERRRRNAATAAPEGRDAQRRVIPPSPPSNRSGNTLRVALQDEWRNSNPRFKSTGSTTGRRSVERRRRNAATAAPEGRDAQRRVIPPSPPNHEALNTPRIALHCGTRNSNPRL